jgi:hypothetical protein
LTSATAIRKKRGNYFAVALRSSTTTRTTTKTAITTAIITRIVCSQLAPNNTPVIDFGWFGVAVGFGCELVGGG